MFPEGIRIDTVSRQYRTSQVNILFSVKRSFSNEKADIKKGLPIKSDEESTLVDYTIEISNLDLMGDIIEIIDYVELTDPNIIIL